MKRILQNPKLRNIGRALQPWAIFIGIFFVLKVTGLGSEISALTQSALLKAGVMDLDPGNNTTSGKETFNYNFVVKDLDGNDLHMKELKGKVIFLNLWATWCGPCRVEMPAIQNLYNDVDKNKVAFVMLSLDEARERQKVIKYITGKAFTFPVYQPATSLPQVLRVRTIPTTFIISPDGKIASKKTGMANYDTEEMREFLKALSSDDEE